MQKTFRIHALLRCCVLLALSAGISHSAFSQTGTNSIAVPDGQSLLLTVHGEGSQVYKCSENQWTLVAPDAKLLDEKNNVVGRHYAGPSWQLSDGSTLTAKAVAKQASPEANAVPWLLLKADAGSGRFAGAQYIQRTQTHGGAAPSGACNSSEELRVPYKALYSFYGTPAAK